MTRNARRATVVVLAVASSALVCVPAFAAESTDPSVVDQTVTTMSPVNALLIFLGIPVAFGALVWLLVSAPSWTRGGRPSSADAWTGDPHVVDAAEAPPALVGAGDAGEAVEPASGATQGAGGTSASW